MLYVCVTTVFFTEIDNDHNLSVVKLRFAFGETKKSEQSLNEFRAEDGHEETMWVMMTMARLRFPEP
jgi:hypothetical protein